MKTSNIIVTAFILFVLAGALTLVVFTKMNYNNGLTSYQGEDILLPPFSVIVGETGTFFTVVKGHHNKMSVSYAGKKQPLPAPYILKNDTLYVVEKYFSNNQKRTLRIHCTKLRKLILRNSCEATINYPDTLTIYSNHANLKFTDENVSAHKKEYTIPQLKISATNSSNLNFNRVHINNMNIDAQHSVIKLESSGNINILTANLQKSSNLFIFKESMKNQTKKLLITSDSTSSYYIIGD